MTERDQVSAQGVAISWAVDLPPEGKPKMSFG